MVTQIWTLQICIVLFCFKIILKFSVKFINEQYKVFKFNIILKIYIFHLTVVMINSDRLVKLFLIRIWLVNKNKCLTRKKIGNVRCLFYNIQDQKICKILFKVTLRAIECLRNMIHIAYNAKYSNKSINIQIIILKNVY